MVNCTYPACLEIIFQGILYPKIFIRTTLKGITCCLAQPQPMPPIIRLFTYPPLSLWPCLHKGAKIDFPSN